MNAILLLFGILSDADYRRILDAERRGLRAQVARPGWRNRWANVITTVFLVLAACVAAVTFAVLVLSS